MKKLALLMIATFLLALFASCGFAAEATKRVAVSLPPANNAWQARLLDDVNDEASKYPEFEFTVKNAVDDNDQINQLNIFRNENYDLIMILPGDGTLLTSTCVEIYNSGTPTVILDRAIESDQYTAFVAGDNYGGGVNAARYLAGLLGGKGDIAVLRSYAGIPIDIARYTGFVDTITVEFPEMKIIVEGDGEFNREAGLAAMTNILPGYPHIDAVYSQDDETALGALVAIENARRDDIRFITGFGGTLPTYERFRANDPVYKASMSYFPSQGRDGIRTCVAIPRGEEVPKVYISPSVVVTSENVEQFRPEAY
jgi:ribose transport system substrate-binding protein